MRARTTDELRVLIIDGGELDAEAAVRDLRRHWASVSTLRVGDAARLGAALEDATWDVILSGWSAEGFDGFGGADALRAAQLAGVDLPFIVVTKTASDEVAIAALHAGAHDFLIEGEPARLGLTVERELRASDARSRALFENSPLPTLVYDRATLGLLAANDAAVSHYGYDRDELASLTIEDLQAPDDPLSEEALLAKAPGPARERHRKKDGTPFVVETTSQDIRFAGLPARVLVAQDVTARLRAERDVRKSEERSRDAQRLEAIGNLASGVAHDFNNLLSIITSYASIALQALTPGDPVRDDIEEIRRAAARAADVTRKLLAFGRTQRLAPRRVDLHALLREMEDPIREVLGASIRLSVVAGANLGLVDADPAQLELVLHSLLVNARDAMPSGGTVTIETEDVILDEAHAAQHPGLRPGPHVLLAIRDTGAGMDSETLARVFDPYFTTRGAGQRAGMGLSTVFGIIKQTGGSISGSSQVARGTTFRVYLPCGGSDAPSDGDEAASLVASHERFKAVGDDGDAANAKA